MKWVGFGTDLLHTLVQYLQVNIQKPCCEAICLSCPVRTTMQQDKMAKFSRQFPTSFCDRILIVRALKKKLSEIHQNKIFSNKRVKTKKPSQQNSGQPHQVEVVPSKCLLQKICILANPVNEPVKKRGKLNGL
jgi:hypothetical protein